MIEDKCHFRTRRRQVDSDGKLACQDAKIKRKAVVRKAANILDESFPLTYIIRLGMQDTANSFQFGMAGNLIDNAFKWAHSRIVVQAAPIDGGRFFLSVSDDGLGLAPEERSRAMECGERLDESVPGTGLGLAIVRDIAKLYGGNFVLGESSMGGLEARLELPRMA